MEKNQPRIYTEGVSINSDCLAQIHKIAETVETFSPGPDLSIRLLKSGRTYEGLLWGKADGQSIGVYNRGPSLPQVLEILHRKVQRQCLKLGKNKYGHFVGKTQTYDRPLEMAA